MGLNTKTYKDCITNLHMLGFHLFCLRCVCHYIYFMFTSYKPLLWTVENDEIVKETVKDFNMLSVCVSVCLSTRFLKNCLTDWNQTWRTDTLGQDLIWDWFSDPQVRRDPRYGVKRPTCILNGNFLMIDSYT